MSILTHMASAKGLHSLINASPRYFQVFLASRELFLSALVRSTISLEALPEALVAIAGSRNSPRGLSPDSIQVLLDAHSEHRVHVHTEIQLAAATSIPLLKLDASIGYHIARYVETTLPTLEGCSQPLSLGVVNPQIRRNPTSKTEHVRLQRAFYRLHLYCCLFHSSDKPGTNDRNHVQTSSNHQEGVFLSKLPPWEVEEIACVWHYFRGQLGKLFDELEDDFIRTAFQGTHLVTKDVLAHEDRKALLKEAYEDSKKYYRSYESVNTSYLDEFFLGNFANTFFRTHAKRFFHDKWIEYLSSMGLVFLHRLFEANVKEQAQIVRANTCCRSTVKFLTCALNIYGDNAVQRHAAWSSGPIASDKPYLSPNEGFHWARMKLAPSFPCRHKGGLRSLGYVFWDMPRLQGIIGPKGDMPYVATQRSSSSTKLSIGSGALPKNVSLPELAFARTNLAQSLGSYG